MSITIKNKIRKNNKKTNMTSTSVNTQSKYSLAYIWSVFFIGIGFGFIHMYHVSTMFENDTHFSHLSNLEREMCFRSEMGLYYSYYKTIVEAPTFSKGYLNIVQNNITEYPNTIDTLERFNLYPEVVMGYMYRKFIHYTTQWGLSTRECWTIERGRGSEPVTSCEGPGDPIYFYLECIWLLSSITVFLLFIYGVYLSDNIMGGFLSVSSYFFNHSEATRVQWTPPLRENFAFPFILLQMLCVTYLLRRGSHLKKAFQIFLVSLSSWICLLLWQFSQYFLATQLIAVYLICQLNVIPKKQFLNIVSGHLIAIFLSCLCMHGNKLLLSSLHFALATSIVINSFFWKDLTLISKEDSVYFIVIRLVHDSALIICLTIFTKSENPINMLFHNNDDGHIINLLKSKFMNYKDFHTLMYTCAVEFDFLPIETIVKLFSTLLIPAVIFIVIVIVYNWFRKDFKPSYFEKIVGEENQNRLKAYAVEDYLEKNSVTLKQMRSKDMKGKIGEVLENLEKCDYDMKLLQHNRAENKSDKVVGDAKNEFLKNIAELKLEISKNDKRINNYRNNETDVDRNVNEAQCNKDNQGQIKRNNNSKENQKTIMDSIRMYKIKTKTEPEVLYNILQLCAFMIMAGVIMRLKLFLTPHLCIMVSLIAAKRYFDLTNNKPWIHIGLVVLLMLGMSIKGIDNIKEQRNILGEYSNAPLEQLLIWIESNTSNESVFAGPMSVTSAILLSTRRPVVNHPHYENAQIRDITKMVYSVYSRRSALEVYNLLSRLQVQYIVLDYAWCFNNNVSGCRIQDLFDNDEPELKTQPVLCKQLFGDEKLKSFQKVFENSAFTVLKLHSNYVNVDLNRVREYSI